MPSWMDCARIPLTAGAFALSLLTAPAARAETSDLRIATQFGIGAMPMILLQKNKLVEKHLAAAGLSSTKVTWSQFAGGNPINEGLLAGSLDIASGGTTVFVTLWAKAKGTSSAVRAVSALSALPLWLMTRNPNVKTLADLSVKDKIAVTTVKVGVHAILLQMAAEKLYGPAQSGKFDPLTVTIPHGEAAAAMISGVSEINNHFGASPFQEMELKAGARRVTTAQEILGSPATYMIAYATEKFRNDNPKVFAAFVAAMRDVMADINADPRKAARDYLDASKDNIAFDDAVAMITDPEARFTMAPGNVTTFADFMNKQGLIKQKPSSWKEMFFPEIHDMAGS